MTGGPGSGRRPCSAPAVSSHRSQHQETVLSELSVLFVGLTGGGTVPHNVEREFTTWESYPCGIISK